MMFAHILDISFTDSIEAENIYTDNKLSIHKENFH